MFEEELDAALENEGREDVGAVRVVEVIEEVPASAKATAGKRDERSGVGDGLGRRRQRGPGPHPLA